MIHAILLATVVLCQVEAPATHVTDEAHFLSPNMASALERQLADFNNTTPYRIAVVTINDMGGDSIEHYTRELANKMHLDREKKGAVLFLVSRKERKARFEISDGIVTSIFTEAAANRIMQNDVIPAFKRKDFQSGIMVGTQQVVLALTPVTPPPRQEKPVFQESRQEPFARPSERTSEAKAEKSDNTGVVITILLFFFGVVGGFALVAFIKWYLGRQSRRRRCEDLIERYGTQNVQAQIDFSELDAEAPGVFNRPGAFPRVPSIFDSNFDADCETIEQVVDEAGLYKKTLSAIRNAKSGLAAVLDKTKEYIATIKIKDLKAAESAHLDKICDDHAKLSSISEPHDWRDTLKLAETNKTNARSLLTRIEEREQKTEEAKRLGPELEQKINERLRKIEKKVSKSNRKYYEQATRDIGNRGSDPLDWYLNLLLIEKLCEKAERPEPAPTPPPQTDYSSNYTSSSSSSGFSGGGVSSSWDSSSSSFDSGSSSSSFDSGSSSSDSGFSGGGASGDW